ncbi:glycerate kinase [Maribacter sp. 2304DJ31-5]|uniref:glycerate kinase n=1 Tax=Maribacter sp. 2304DJ31-5 TaxID=3386273 RepID=UPI0039BC6163
MKFVIAPDKFKDSLTGHEFCEAAESGIQKVFPDAVILKRPLADGGDGTIEVIRRYLDVAEISVEVNDPLFRKMEARYLFSEKEKMAFIEMSEASGYKLLVKEELNCVYTTSLGTGELIVDALNKGAKELILGIGGSATNDGGMGLASALGYKFLDGNGNTLIPIGENLHKVKRIEGNNLHKRLDRVTINVACDVNNPFYGKNGAAYIYASQKGASKTEVRLLDDGLMNFAEIIKRKFGIDLQNLPGSGAAGGVGGGARAFLGATLSPGIDLIKKMVDFDHSIKGADWIITGEGCLDAQTLSGKTMTGIITSAQKHHIPVAALCGSVHITPEQQKSFGLSYTTSVLRTIGTLEDAMANSYENVEAAAYNFAKVISR